MDKYSIISLIITLQMFVFMLPWLFVQNAINGTILATSALTWVIGLPIVVFLSERSDKKLEEKKDE